MKSKLTGEYRICPICNSLFYVPLWRLKIGKGKFCSKKCYSISCKGKPAWNKGKCPSDQTYEKMRASGTWYTKGESHPQFGKPISPEIRAKMAKAKLGHTVSAKAREKIRLALIGKCVGEKSSQFGKPLSAETKAKISASRRGKYTGEQNHQFGKPPTPKTRAILKEKLKGHPPPNKGKPMSEEQREKLIELGLGGFWYGNVRYYDGPQYCVKWTNELRERVRAYFGYKCVECGAPQNGRKLAVHHVHYNKRLCCDDTPRTLVPLCHSCHAKTNVDRVYWSEHFQEMVDEYYGGKCWFTKEEYKKFVENGFK